MTYNPRDHYFRKAKEQNFAARSIFKLEEIDQKFKLLKPGNFVMDLGASPGSWSQYASRVIGPAGRLVGVDLNDVKPEVKSGLKNAHFITADLRDLEMVKIIQDLGIDSKFDVVMSDMAPKTTGIRVTDQARSFELCELALATADQFLKPRGHFVCKFFHSEDFGALRDKMRSKYTRVEAIKPDSTRKISKEIFLVGLNRK